MMMGIGAASIQRTIERILNSPRLMDCFDAAAPRPGNIFMVCYPHVL